MARREEWSGRVGAWRRSGQTAKAYAKSTGVNAGTLTYWAWRLGSRRRRRPSDRKPRGPQAAAPAMIEVVTASGLVAEGFEVQLGSGHRVQVPARFDAAALKRLIAVLEEPA